MLANTLAEYFTKGGPIMYPIALVAIILFAVVAERGVFWFLLGRRRNMTQLENTLGAMENSDFKAAVVQTQGSNDPVVRMIYQGLTHMHGSLQGALQVAAGMEIKRAGRFMVLIDTCITLAPLLGLLGTVTGIMGSFQKMGESSIAGAMTEIQGGIGEALIATAAGLGLAIIGVFFLNIYNEMMEKLKFDLETAATNVEVMVTQAKQDGFDTVAFRREIAAKNP
jgi:biopolymer transport protein ExbB